MLLQLALLAILTLFYLLLLYFRRRTTSGVPPRRSAATKRGVYTVDEVRRHAASHDLWLVIKGKVYDFTSYVQLHPGGDAILRNAGADSTKGFSGPQHPDRVWDMLADFYIGELDTNTIVQDKKHD